MLPDHFQEIADFQSLGITGGFPTVPEGVQKIVNKCKTYLCHKTNCETKKGEEKEACTNGSPVYRVGTSLHLYQPNLDRKEGNLFMGKNISAGRSCSVGGCYGRSGHSGMSTFNSGTCVFIDTPKKG